VGPIGRRSILSLLLGASVCFGMAPPVHPIEPKQEEQGRDDWAGPRGGSSIDAYDRVTNVVNKTSRVLVQLFASNVSQSNWGADLLGPTVISSESSIRINVDDGSGYCRYDLKAVFDDGTVAIAYGFDVCSSTEWTIYD
jgi:hypothetical protein